MTKETTSPLTLTSPAFESGGKIPPKYTCDGENVNPPLSIQNIPDGTQSLALIVDDPDAPAKIWLHWSLWNISPNTTEFEEDNVPIGAIEGITDFGETGYGGPCPHSGEHRYFFKLYALDAILDLKPGATKTALEEAMERHILAKTELSGRYERK